MKNRIYLDNAATTWPKFREGLAAAVEFIESCGATAGRGTYKSSLVADRWLQDARANLAALIHAPDSTGIAICNSGTHALNAALHGTLRRGDHVITTAAEHNSLLRPLEAMRNWMELEVDIVPVDRCGRSHADDAQRLLRSNTRLLAIGHASNVTGAVTDISAWSQLAQSSGTPLLVDASQSIGYTEIDLSTTKIDMLAAAGHKGLRALAGSGFLYVERGLRDEFYPLMLGGTGRSSESLSGGSDWPHCVEVGNLNLPAIVSMAVCAKHLINNPNEIHAWVPAFKNLVSGLTAIEGIEFLGFEQDNSSDPSQPAKSLHDRLPVISLRVAGWQPHDLAAVLDDAFDIETRAGWHCAAAIHDAIGTGQDGGTLRLSSGHSTTLSEVDAAIAALTQIVTGE